MSNKQWSDWHKGFNDELFPAPFNLAGEPLRSEIDAEGEARVRALAESEARKAQELLPLSDEMPFNEMMWPSWDLIECQHLQQGGDL